MDDDVHNFHERHDLGTVVDENVLKRGVRVARDPRNLTPQAVPGMTRAEEKTLKEEKDFGIRQQTKELKITVLTTACAAVVQ